MASPWTNPDPFVSPAASPISYCGIYFEEVQREINQQCSALSITKPTWYRYDSTSQRTGYNPSADTSGESLNGYDYAFKDYITDIRNAYEGTGGATGLFSTWDITRQEYLEAKYATAEWPSSHYSSWAHSAGALSEDGDLYDRDLGELRSYVSTVAQHDVQAARDDDLDGQGDAVAPGGTFYVGDNSYDNAFRGIIYFDTSKYPPSFRLALLKFNDTVPEGSEGDPFELLGDFNIAHFTDETGTIVKGDYERSATLVSSYGNMPINVDVTDKLKADISAGVSYSGFKGYFDTACNQDQKDQFIQVTGANISLFFLI